MSLVSFVDSIQIGEDGAINFVFNNIETMNLLQAIVDSEGIEDKKTINTNLIPMSKLVGEHLENNTQKSAIGGVC